MLDEKKDSEFPNDETVIISAGNCFCARLRSIARNVETLENLNCNARVSSTETFLEKRLNQINIKAFAHLNNAFIFLSPVCYFSQATIKTRHKKK